MDTATAIFTPKDNDPAQRLTGQFNFTQITPTKVHVSGQLTNGMVDKDVRKYKFWIADSLGILLYELSKGVGGWSINDNGGTTILQSDFEEGFSVKGTYGIVNLKLEVSLESDILGSAQIKEVV
ncbi:26932_t:CDS:1 [Dentiscutata erythropus]|uniref:26932_t:CDS:1 n=1 Tax=Dentiscutata erythropus TaxID=1348616 RepID=A0A9N9AEI6_9GLOM|nr:26932_t:CDS:1 [Dentiscutata erythropus]